MFKTINGGQLPQRATKYSAGFDVFANEDTVIGAGETVVIGLGICIDPSKLFTITEDENSKLMFNVDGFQCEDITSHYFELHPRSSLRAKGLGGGVGVIDMDYRDEIKMVIYNPICMDAIDSAIRAFHVGMETSLRRLSDKQVEEAMKSFLESRKDLLGMASIKRGDKIGQLILNRHEGWLLPSEYTKDEERMGGFGSTGEG